MRKCKNDHEIDDANAKRCGECGSEVPDELIKCTCGTEILKAKVGTPGNKFCTGCGETLEPTPALDEALEELSAFAKAKATIETDLATLPAAAETEIPQERVNEIIKAATIKDGDEVLGLNPEPIFTAILKAVGAISPDFRLLVAHLAKGVDERAQRAELANGLLIKSVLAMGREMGSLREQLTATGNAPRGTKSVDGRTIAVAGRSGPAPRAEQATGLRGDALFLKAKQAGDVNPAIALSLQEVALLEQHTDHGHGVAEIAQTKNRMGLAHRVAALVGETVPALTTTH